MYQNIHINNPLQNIIQERIPPGSVILYGILNWGLGHASRSIPIIQELLRQGHVVHVATGGLAYKWLTNELEGVSLHKLKEMKISYPTRFMWFNVFFQIPLFLYQLYIDYKQAGQFLKITDANVIISDNRFVFRNQLANINIYITHQINIHHNITFISKILSKCHQYFINKFSECWIPDDKFNPLAGKLSDPGDLLQMFYIGNISRIKFHPNSNKNIDILILLSGPEPQRSYLEDDIIKLLFKLENKSITLVRGSKKPIQRKSILPDVIVFDLANSSQIQDLLNRSETVVCRSGYSTLMDVKNFDSRVILIPTPGQTEQEYLAKYLSSKKEDYLTLSQDDVSKKLLLLLKI